MKKNSLRAIFDRRKLVLIDDDYSHPPKETNLLTKLMLIF